MAEVYELAEKVDRFGFAPGGGWNPPFSEENVVCYVRSSGIVLTT